MTTSTTTVKKRYAIFTVVSFLFFAICAPGITSAELVGSDSDDAPMSSVASSSVFSPVSSSGEIISVTFVQGRLNLLLSKVRNMVAVAERVGIVPPQTMPTVASFPASVTFAENLFVGSQGNEVSALQAFLVSKNTGTATEQLASVGATGTFGRLTKQALIEFQKNVGIIPASGYFGSKTRAYINSL